MSRGELVGDIELELSPQTQVVQGIYHHHTAVTPVKAAVRVAGCRMTPTRSSSLVFTPGPLGLELEPSRQGGKRRVGCCVSGFKISPDGSPGQAERLGVRLGDVLSEVDGVLVHHMSFEKIVALLQRDTHGFERRLTFQSHGLPATTGATCPALMPLSPKLRNRQSSPASSESNSSVSHPRINTAVTSAGGSTQPATPSSTGSKCRTSGENGESLSGELAVSFVRKGGSRQQKQRLGWAFGLVGAGGVRAAEAGAAAFAEMDGSPGRVACDQAAGDAGFGGNDGNAWWGGSREAEPEETPTGGGVNLLAACGSCHVEKDSKPDSHDQPTVVGVDAGDPIATGTHGHSLSPTTGTQQLFVEACVMSIGSRPGMGIGGQQLSSACAASTETDDGDCGKAGEHDPAATGNSSLPEGMSERDDRRLMGSTNGDIATQVTAVNSGGHSAKLLQAAEEVTWSNTARQEALGSPGTPGGIPKADLSEEHQQPPPLRHASCVISSTPPLTTPPAFSPGPFANNRASTGTTRPPDAGEPGRLRVREGVSSDDRVDERVPSGSSPETIDRSLDTVSLLSEPGAHAQSVQRMSMLANLWGGGGRRGQQIGNGAGCGASDGACDGESEIEGVRRLARSLAVKLKERARRCDELEDLFALRDHQVSMLQRQSNALAVHVSSLADDLSDKSALIEALQEDRERLELELTQARLSRYQDEGDAGGPTVANRSSLSSSSSSSSSSPSSSPSSPPVDDKVQHVGAIVALGDKVTEESLSPMGTAATSRTLAEAVDAAEAKAAEKVAAAEARCLALTEVVDSLVAEKIKWEEKRVSSSAETARLRALVRGLEEALVDRGVGDEEDGDFDVGACESTETRLVSGLRRLLRERTRELEAKGVALERLGVHARELDEEKRRLIMSLSAREEDILVSDRQMRALSMRLKGEARSSSEAAARAEAVAEELRRALEEANETAAAVDWRTGEEAGSPCQGRCGGEKGANDRPSLADRIKWAEERVRLEHNLLSLRQALRDRDTQAEAAEATMSSRLKASQDDCEWSARENVSLRETVDSLRVELAEAVTEAAARGRRHESVPVVGGDPRERLEVQDRQPSAASPGSVGASKEDVASAEAASVGVRDDGSGHLGSTRLEEHAASEGKQESEPGTETRGENEQGTEDCRRSPSTAVKRRELTETDPDDRPAVSDSGAADAAAVVTGAHKEWWLDGGFEGTIDNSQLELMEKDIVIEQLRCQVKQLRSRMALMEEDQAGDTTPLRGLLNQLGELKGAVEEREDRERRCRDQVDLGLMRMERLREENVAAITATVAAAPITVDDGLAGASSTVLPQGDPHGQAQVEQQRLRRQLEDSQFELRAVERRIEEYNKQLRDARGDADRIMGRARVAERDLEGAREELAVAAAEAAAERRRVGALRVELHSVRSDLVIAREGAANAAAAAKSSAEQQRLRLEAESRDRLSAVAAAEAQAERCLAALSTTLRAVTAERDKLLEGKRAVDSAAAARQNVEIVVAAQDVAARTREVESMRCALAARDVELESIVDAMEEFCHHADNQGVGDVGGAARRSGIALRGALAAATEARRAGRLVAELREEISSLKSSVDQGRTDATHLRAALEQAKLAERRATAAADAAAAQLSLHRSPENHTNSTKGRYSAAEADSIGKRAQEAEEALQKALAGAQQAWGVLSSCLGDESIMEGSDLAESAATTTNSTCTTVPPATASPSLRQQHPASSDPSLNYLISGVEVLATAYRDRGHAVRRAMVTARAKTVCAREARRRQEAEGRARENAEARLDEALIALDDCRRHRQHELHRHPQQQRQHQSALWDAPQGECRKMEAADGSGGIPGLGGAGGSRSFLSREQEEHLRQIRSEVDRLEGQNRTLRRSLEGAEATGRITGSTSDARSRGGERVRGGTAPSRSSFPPSSSCGIGAKEAPQHTGSLADCWECADGLSGSSGRSRTPSPIPVRPWATFSDVHGGSPWPDVRVCGRKDDANDGFRRGGTDDVVKEGDHDEKDARARVLEECAGCSSPPRDDGSSGTLVADWGKDT